MRLRKKQNLKRKSKMNNITVIGAGTMGNGISHVFAQKGHPVILIDLSEESLERALATIDRNLDRLVTKERITEELKASTLANISTSTDLRSAVSNADLVVEAATENIDLKLKIFEDIDKAAPANCCLLYTSPSPRDRQKSRMPSSA